MVLLGLCFSFLFFFRGYEGGSGLKLEVFRFRERGIRVKRGFTLDVISIPFKFGLKDIVCTVLIIKL